LNGRLPRSFCGPYTAEYVSLVNWMYLAVNLTYRMAERQGQKSQEPAGADRSDLTRSPKSSGPWSA